MPTHVANHMIAALIPLNRSSALGAPMRLHPRCGPSSVHLLLVLLTGLAYVPWRLASVAEVPVALVALRLGLALLTKDDVLAARVRTELLI